MDALVWTAPAVMQLQEAPVPTPGAGELLLQVSAVGVCGSELSGYLGHSSLRVPPLIMGHEFTGRIMAPGAGLLADGTRPQVGGLVAVNPLINCGACDLCRDGLPQLCRRRQIVGAHRPGGFAARVAVPAAQCWPLPPGFDAVAGALAEPLACAVRAVGHAAWNGAGPLLIIGAGAIGLLGLAAARAEHPPETGPGPIVISDVVDARLRVAAAWGASTTVNGRAAGGEATLRAALPHGAAAVIDAVGSDATRALAVQLVRPGGRVVFIGLHDEASPLAANYVVRQEVSIHGSFAYTPEDFAHALDLLWRGVVAPSPLWLAERPLHEGGAVFAGLVDGSITTPKVILRPG